MLRLLADEDVPARISRELIRRQPILDVVRVQSVGLMGVSDSEVLEWAARNGRQIFTRDRNTMTASAYARVSKTIPMLGLFVIPQRMTIGQAVTELELIALASQSDEWISQVIFLPL